MTEDTDVAHAEKSPIKGISKSLAAKLVGVIWLTKSPPIK